MPLYKKVKMDLTKQYDRKDRAMNEKEQKEFYIAMCGCCLLAQTMKTCAGCRFNIGLPKPAQEMVAIPIPLPIQVQTFVFAEQN